MIEYSYHKQLNKWGVFLKDKKTVWKAVLIAALIVAIICVCYLIYLFTGRIMSEKEKEQYTNTTAVTKVLDTRLDSPVDFEKLKATNPEIVGWLKVDGTDIDYPVLRTSSHDDDYYLNHTYDNKYSSAGAIYMEKKNLATFQSPVTVLYGHNWRNNGYFRPLYSFKDKDFFEKNRYMYIYTPGHRLKYEIYAAYEYDDRHILNSFDFTNIQTLDEYLQSTLSPASLVKNVKSGVTLDTTDKILTLSTCVEGVRTSRYLVQGVLVEDSATK